MSWHFKSDRSPYEEFDFNNIHELFTNKIIVNKIKKWISIVTEVKSFEKFTVINQYFDNTLILYADGNDGWCHVLGTLSGNNMAQLHYLITEMNTKD